MYRLRPTARSATSAKIAQSRQAPTQQLCCTGRPWKALLSRRLTSSNVTHGKQTCNTNLGAAARAKHVRQRMTWQVHRPESAARQLCATAGIASTLAPTYVTTYIWNGSQMLAQALGYLVLVGACFRSVPQILRILRAKRATGVSLTSNVVELLAYSITMAYNFRLGYAFSTYGEVVACWLQDMVLVALIARMTGISDSHMLFAAAAFALYCWWLTSASCTTTILTILQVSTISMIALGGRLPQIVLNIRRRNSGELSLTTCLLNLVGNIIRVFTTMVLTQDPLILTGNAVQAILNTILLWQTVHTTMKSQRARGSENTMNSKEEVMGLSPAAIEAAEDVSESPEAGINGDGSAPAMGGGGDGGDGGGYGGVGSSFFELSPVDLPLKGDEYE